MMLVGLGFVAWCESRVKLNTYLDKQQKTASFFNSVHSIINISLPNVQYLSTFLSNIFRSMLVSNPLHFLMIGAFPPKVVQVYDVCEQNIVLQIHTREYFF